MDQPDLIEDVHYLRDVVARAQGPAVNRFWPVTLSWGCIIAAGYLICGMLARTGHFNLLAWVWPVLIFLVAMPMNFVLVRRVRRSMEAAGVRPRFRKELVACWASLSAVGAAWTFGLIVSGSTTGRWWILGLLWTSLYLIGYIMNGVLVSPEWFWAAVALVASAVAVYLAGPSFYWLMGIWMGGTMILAGLLGRRRVHHLAPAA